MFFRSLFLEILGFLLFCFLILIYTDITILFRYNLRPPIIITFFFFLFGLFGFIFFFYLFYFLLFLLWFLLFLWLFLIFNLSLIFLIFLIFLIPVSLSSLPMRLFRWLLLSKTYKNIIITVIIVSSFSSMIFFFLFLNHFIWIFFMRFRYLFNYIFICFIPWFLILSLGRFFF